MAHGDDIMTLGSRQGLYWLKKGLETRYKLKTEHLSEEPQDAKEIRILIRVIRIEDRRREKASGTKRGQGTWT